MVYVMRLRCLFPVSVGTMKEKCSVFCFIENQILHFKFTAVWQRSAIMQVYQKFTVTDVM